MSRTKTETKTKTARQLQAAWGAQLRGKSNLVWRVVTRVMGRGRARYRSSQAPSALQVTAVPGSWFEPPIPGSALFAFSNDWYARRYVAQQATFGVTRELDLEIWLAEADQPAYPDRLVIPAGEPYDMRLTDGSWIPQPATLTEQLAQRYWARDYRTTHDLVPAPPGTIWAARLRLLERLEVTEKRS